MFLPTILVSFTNNCSSDHTVVSSFRQLYSIFSFRPINTSCVLPTILPSFRSILVPYSRSVNYTPSFRSVPINTSCVFLPIIRSILVPSFVISSFLPSVALLSFRSVLWSFQYLLPFLSSNSFLSATRSRQDHGISLPQPSA